jgi:hypothetical protein
VTGDDDLASAGWRTSGLVGGEDEVVGTLSERSSSDLVDDVVEDDAALGKISGALYESKLVVWMSSMGAEILCLIEPADGFVVLLRCSAMALSAASGSSLTFRVVKARVRDILVNSAQGFWFSGR